MRVFVLCTGRNGSVSFAKACQHITNFTAGHETKANALGASRIEYPDRHIEADNRLSWFLGQLDTAYGDEPLFVHLKRDFNKTVNSFMNRWNGRGSVVYAYCEGLKMIPPEKLDKEQKVQICKDYVETVTMNIDFFLKDKSKVLEIYIENIKDDFPKFWEAIGAEGDMDEALKTFDVKYNASPKGTISEVSSKIKYDLKLFFLRLLRRFE